MSYTEKPEIVYFEGQPVGLFIQNVIGLHYDDIDNVTPFLKRFLKLSKAIPMFDKNTNRWYFKTIQGVDIVFKHSIIEYKKILSYFKIPYKLEVLEYAQKQFINGNTREAELVLEELKIG